MAKKVEAVFKVNGAAQAASEVKTTAKAVEGFTDEVEGAGAAAGKTNGAAKALRREMTETRTVTDRARTAMDAIKQSFTLLAGSIAFATKALKLFVKGVQTAREDAKGEIAVRVNTTFAGETPEEHEKRIQKIHKIARAAMKTTGVSEDEIAAAASLKPEKFVEAGGAEQGAMLGKITGMGTAGGMEWLARQAELFGGAEDPKQLKGYVNTLLQASRAGNVEPGVIMDALERSGAGFAERGGTFEDAAMVAASMARRSPVRLGASMEAFFGTVGGADAKKRAEFKRAGFDFYDPKTGNIRSIDEIQGQFARFSEKNPAADRREEKLNELFGGRGKDVGAMFAGLDPAAMRAEMGRSAGVDAYTKEMRGTLDFWVREIGEQLTEGVGDAFSPVEKAGAKAGQSAAGQAERLREWMGTETGQKAVMAAPIVGAGLALLGGGASLFNAIKKQGGLGKFLAGEASDTGSTAAGVAKGWALSAATGGKVQPVFVVNWPAGGAIGGGEGSGDGGVGPAATPGLIARAGKKALAAGRGALGGLAALGGTSVGAAGAGAIAGTAAVGAALGAGAGYALNRATMEDAAAGDVKVKASLADRLSGSGEEVGLHQLNVFQAGMAHIGAFFGSDSMRRLLDERDALKGGANYDDAMRAADEAAAKRQQEAADAQARSAQTLEQAGLSLYDSAGELARVIGTLSPAARGA